MHRLLLALPSIAIVVGCSRPNEYKPPPPPSVTVARPLVRTITNYLEETGTTAAVERIEVRARVRGYLQEVNFTDGEDIEKGDELYLIQPAEYEAKVAAETADVEAQKVVLARAEIELTRQQNILKENATSQAKVDTALAERDGAAAALDAAKASLKLAQLDLGYTAIKAPISGRVERTLVRAGNLVGDSEATHLTTVMKYDPVHVYFNISERSLLQATRVPPDESEKRMDITKIKAYLRRTLDDGFPFQGHLDYADLGVDQSTGTYTIRAIFPNPDLRIFPGLFVRIRVPVGTRENAVLIPERSVGADQSGRYVMVVGNENIVERRNVRLGARFGDMIVVIEGLGGEQTVVIDGLQRARPGATVTPKEIQLEEPEIMLEAVPADNQSEPAESDAVETDAVETDAVETDAVETDAVEMDAGETDAGETDAVETDAVETDAVETDAVKTDAVKTDAVKTDAGETDAGEPASPEPADAQLTTEQDPSTSESNESSSTEQNRGESAVGTAPSSLPSDK